MIAVEELLQPISEDSPSGGDLRYDPVYDKIKEARREDDDLNQGAWQTERKVADFSQVISLSTNLLKQKTKDLQLAAWLTEALLRKEGIAGFNEGLQLLQGMLEKFWDSVFPLIDEDDLGLRAGPIEWIARKFDVPIRNTALNRDGHNLPQYNESRTVGYEDQAKTPDLKKKREKDLKEGKLPPEAFDKSFTETPKAFYASLEKQLDASLANIDALSKLCDDKFGDDSPSFNTLKTSVQEVRHVTHGLLTKKREIEPDPVVEEPPAEAAAGEGEVAEGGEAGAPAEARPTAISFTLQSTETPARRELVTQVANVAATLRQKEPQSPTPYLMMRGLRWGDLRSAAALADPAMLEAPPTEIRQQIKRLAMQEKWKDLLETAEAVMALPCSRAWLDLQRFVVEACVALGSSYDNIAVAIRSELRCLLRDVPQLLDATLMDDTPAANPKTREWLQQILNEPGGGLPSPASLALDDPSPGMRLEKKFVDSMVVAKEAVRTGQPDRAIDIMNQELSRQRSSRGRFQRRLQFVEICLSAGKDAIVQPMLDDMLATIDAHKLEEWEDKTSMAAALVTIVRASKKIQGDAKEKQKYFERICRLDPALALSL